MVVQSTIEHVVPEGFCVAEGAAFGYTEGTTGGVGEDAGEDEAKREEGGESVESTHVKKSQWALLACFL